MNKQKELLELYGLILGDGSYYIDRGKYPHMSFFNFDLNLIRHAKKLIEKISQKKMKISSRKRKTGIEYSIYIPTIITKKLLELGFNKKRIPECIINNTNAISLLKGFFESDGSYDGSRIYIHQKEAKELLKDCQRIANKFGLSAHIHNSSKRRRNEQYLVIEDTKKIRKLFKKTVKKIVPRVVKKGNYHLTKREILSFLHDIRWSLTSEIYSYLKRKGINMSKRSSVLLNKHLNLLWKKGILLKMFSRTTRNKRGQFIKTECKWKLKRKLSKNKILNFPYEVE